MAWTNSRAAYGWMSILLHWISAIAAPALYLLGDRIEEAPDRAAHLAARDLHVSVAAMLFAFLLARLLWSAAQPRPVSLERNIWLRRLGGAVHVLFLAMIAVLIVTGPLTIWSGGRPITAFGTVVAPSPMGRIAWLHEATEQIHGAASKLFWPLIVLHVGGALKHLLVDRDRTLLRMLRPDPA